MAEVNDHPCPEESMLDVADKAIKHFEGSHEQPDRARGGVALFRFCLKEIQQKVTCEKPVLNTYGQLVCPLGDLARAAATRAAGVWPQSAYYVDLEKILTASCSSGNGTKPTHDQTGQYL